MTDIFEPWLDRFFSSARPVLGSPPDRREPMEIEVEYLPDYVWRNLGFRQPRRLERAE